MDTIIDSIVAWSQKVLGQGEARLEDIALTAAAWVLLFLARLVTHRIIEHRTKDVQRRYVINKTFNYVFGIIFFIALISIWFGGLTSWSAYLGLVSAGLAIALQDPLVNLAGWIFISVRKPFTVGDRIEWDYPFTARHPPTLRSEDTLHLGEVVSRDDTRIESVTRYLKDRRRHLGVTSAMVQRQEGIEHQLIGDLSA
jgi:hypothetical protein